PARIRLHLSAVHCNIGGGGDHRPVHGPVDQCARRATPYDIALAVAIEIPDARNAPARVRLHLSAVHSNISGGADHRPVHGPVDQRARGAAPQNIAFVVTVEITNPGDAAGCIGLHQGAVQGNIGGGADDRAVHGPVDQRARGATPEHVGVSVTVEV